MNKPALAAGVLLIASGFAMNLLLIQLANQTFRADRNVWVVLSYATIVVGAVSAGVGMMRGGGIPARVTVQQASRYFSRLALVNVLAAAAFASPLLVPSFEFPILITRWPGIYMVVAYTFFVLVGVLGNAGWSSLLTSLAASDGISSLRKWGLYAQLSLTGIAAYTLAASMFLGGYVGASLDYGGAQSTLVGISMEFTVVPAALSIFAVIVGECLGVVNVMESIRGTKTRIV